MSYAGDITSAETYAALASDPDAVLVDVRTEAELVHVGHPDLTGLSQDLIAVQWVSPVGVVNQNFISELADRGVSPDATVYFLCRSGARSRSAAEQATAAGFSSAFNVSDGFEGQPNHLGHRGESSGWKAAGLPWRQS
ncbi:MAG: rhodanese-like domain-containing protein [Acidimicrobiia bacterium]